ncbi:MAG: hypothetical protein IPH06_05055 [Alphaproteobacteria bacterium]|nr:hypothetical protein [Alphaproteobacteria bacterium]QQS57392.1 MAG: hypothetical protein IPN28_00815 [Alphaproteobacteria bacterium]
MSKVSLTIALLFLMLFYAFRQESFAAFFLSRYISSLEQKLDEQQKRSLLVLPLEGLSGLHLSYGLQIRNNYIYNSHDYFLFIYMYANGIFEPDGMSSKILYIFWESLYNRLPEDQKSKINELRLKRIQKNNEMIKIMDSCTSLFSSSKKMLNECFNENTHFEDFPYYFEEISISKKGNVGNVILYGQINNSEKICVANIISNLKFPNLIFMEQVTISADCVPNGTGFFEE